MQPTEPMQQLRAVQEEGGLRLRRGTTASKTSATLDPTRSPPYSCTTCPDIEFEWECPCGTDDVYHFDMSRFIGKCHGGAHLSRNRYHPSLYP